MPIPSKAVHILGLGNLGKLVAHSLQKSHPEKQISLLFHRESLAEEWGRSGRYIKIERNGASDCRDGFREESTREGGAIYNLVVATKTHSTVQALLPLKERLSSDSTILFVQNGIGTIDEVTSEVFPEQDQHPSYLTGVFNHGVYSTGPFSCVHAGIANAVIGPVDSHQARLTPSYLAQSIIECPDLSTTLLSAPEILHAQLRKLTVNATINPLTAIYNCTNGELFEHASIREFIDSMLAEISAVIIAHLGTLPQHFKPSSETTDMSYLASYEMFSPEALKEEVYKAGKQTYKNISSMNQDVRAGRKTEIGYITGWITKRSEDLGLNSPFNETVEMVVGFSEILNLKTQSNMLYEKMHQFKFPVSVCE